ncbi:MAG: twin-arginine translocase subunit TatC [Polyangiaceae bacterium]|nr:twin-arginine translocase subunit TatC [Polyangiaceae bacterium]
MQNAEEQEDAPGTMSFWEHLDELRSRLFKMILFFLLGAACAWVFKEELLSIMTRPFVEGWGSQENGPSLHFAAPAALFMAYVKLAVLGGFVLSLPFQLYQLWAFIAPGLYAKEKKFALPFVISSTVLFATGGFFGWKVVFPVAFDFLLGMQRDQFSNGLQVEATVMVNEYLQFVIRALLAFGAVFEIPVVVFFLSVAGVLHHRHLIRFARYFVVIAFVVSAVITPPDPLSQLLMAGPLCFLYVLSIGIAYIFGRKNLPVATDS